MTLRSGYVEHADMHIVIHPNKQVDSKHKSCITPDSVIRLKRAGSSGGVSLVRARRLVDVYQLVFADFR